jgi:hypothetical protein
VATATTTIVSMKAYSEAVNMGCGGIRGVEDQLAKRGEEVLMSPRHYHDTMRRTEGHSVASRATATSSANVLHLLRRSWFGAIQFMKTTVNIAGSIGRSDSFIAKGLGRHAKSYR